MTKKTNAMKKTLNVTFKLVAALFGLIHPDREFGHFRQDVVELDCLPLALHYDWKHSYTSQHRSYRRGKTETGRRRG